MSGEGRMTPEQAEETKIKDTLDLWDKGTNLGRIQTIRFHLRYIGEFSMDERAVLWDEGILHAAELLPGDTPERIVVYLGGDEEVYLGFSIDGSDPERFFHVTTIKNSSSILDRLRTYIDYLRLKWRTRSL